MTTTQKQTEKAEAIARLKAHLRDGQVVYTFQQHRSASGLMRLMRLITIDGQDLVSHPNWMAAKACGFPLVSKDGYDCLKVNGCGFSAGDHIVEAIARATGLKLRHEAL